MDNIFVSNPYISYLISPAIAGIIIIYFLHYAISLGSFRERFKHLENDVSDLKDDMSIVKKDITTLKVDVAELKSGFKSMQEDLGIIKSILLKNINS